jgi:transcriptional regulator with XRE-family HTH domain
MVFDQVDEQGIWRLAEADFADALTRLMNVLGCTGYQLAELTEVDRPYLHRLSSGEKLHPSRKTVLKIAAGLVRLGADILVVDELLLTAGYAPIFIATGVPFLAGWEKRA